MEELIGRSAASMRETGWAVNVHPDDVERLMAVPEQYGDADSILIDQFRVVHPDGSVRWLRARANRLLDEDGQPIQTIGTAADITDFVLAAERVRESEERTRAILETAAEGIVTADEHGLVVEFNAAAERITGYDSDEVVGRVMVESLLGPDQSELLMGYFTEYLDGSGDRLVGAAPIEIEVLRKDGSTVPVELALTEVVTSEGRLFTAMIHDISERRAFELELEHRATHDDLTGLPNRALLVAELEAGLNRAARRRTTVGVLFVELGRLKLVTDSLGHRAGDAVIIEAAHRLTAMVGAEGTVTRFGGDHFVVFLEDLDDAKGAVDVAGRIIEALDRPYHLGAEEAFISSAVGVSVAPHGVGAAETLISNADVAMNRAKLDNGTGIEVFDVEMREWVDNRRKLEVALRHGIERNEFELYYQPVVAVGSGRVHGFEALIRWNHPDLGLLSPAQFVPLAEDSGLILPLGQWIVDDACRQLAAWQRAHPDDPPQISVNLSGRQLALPHLAESVAQALTARGADPAGLHLEITETVLLEDVERVGRTLDELKAIGVKLAMDDFGTGYSSLTYLARLPIDIVKVDRSFVSQLGTPSRDASIVSLVVGLAQTLHLEVVAEGVETDVQLAALADLDCEFAQGYYFARPCPVAEADVHLSARQLGPAGST
jgi:diguanylate cyclase (GGDEF)-like protein/PAS domain S-box-containing protein